MPTYPPTEFNFHLPKNYRVVKNENNEYWVQKKGWFFWRDWRYKYELTWDGGYNYSPRYSSKERACREALEKIQRIENAKNYETKQKTITVIGRC